MKNAEQAGTSTLNEHVFLLFETARCPASFDRFPEGIFKWWELFAMKSSG